MIIIGLSHDMYISSAAAMVDGKIVAAAAEERFSRIKRSRAFPANALTYCLREAKCDIGDVDYFAASWNPGIYFAKFNPLISAQRRFKQEYLFAIPDNILALHEDAEREAEYVLQRIWSSPIELVHR